MSLFDNIPEGTDIIEVRKKVNKMLSEARKKAKPPKCILCGKEQSSFCNSHSVPQMCLRPIADRGKVLHASLAMGFDIGVVDLDGGVNKSGTFNYICRECDAKFFQDYENPDNSSKIFEKFDDYYEKGYIDRVITTNLTYLPAEAKEKPYFLIADMSKFIALIIDSMNHDISIGKVMDPTEKIHRLLAKHNTSL